MCFRSFEEQFTWIGKAYIIATKFQVPQEVILAAEASGFSPQVIPAILPYREHYGNDRWTMIKSCFVDDSTEQVRQLNMSHISLADLSRICSHHRAMELISQDQTMLNTDWALIMEDDVVLNPDVSHDFARLYAREAMKHSLWDNSDEGFLCLGICDGKCKTDVSVFSDDPFSIGKSCHGSCYHAYALTKFTAKSFFERMYQNPGKDLQLDRVMRTYFQTNSEQNAFPTAHIVGANFQSPDDPNRVGIMYQVNHTFIYGASDVFVPQTCFIMRGDGGSITKMLQKYAALVGFCLSRNANPLHCASFVSGEDSIGVFDAFVKGFGIKEVKCIPNRVIVKDTDLPSTQQDSSLQPMLDSISFGTTFVGSFENVKNFPGTGTFLRQLLTSSSPYIRTKTTETVQVISSSSSNWLSGWLQSSQVAITSTPCAPSAVEVCVLISGKGFSDNEKDKDKETLRKFYIAAWKHLLSKYNSGVALRLVLDKAIKESQLQAILSLPTAQNGSSSSICVRSLTKYSETKDKRTDIIDHDMWAIRQLQGCGRIVMARSLLGWWGAYLTSGEVIISSQVKHTLPEWTVI